MQTINRLIHRRARRRTGWLLALAMGLVAMTGGGAAQEAAAPTEKTAPPAEQASTSATETPAPTAEVRSLTGGVGRGIDRDAGGDPGKNGGVGGVRS